jgi:twinfilin-like protein
MAHQSGIKCSPEFVKEFSNADEKVRGYTITIQDESLHHAPIIAKSTWTEDLSNIKISNVGFVALRMDTKTEDDGWEWILFVFIPDTAKVRDKMI